MDEKDDAMQIILKGEIALDEVVVSERKMGTIASRTSVLQTQKITYDEICRAACCNLAESCGTNRCPPNLAVGIGGDLRTNVDRELPEFPGGRFLIWAGLCSGSLDGKYSGV